MKKVSEKLNEIMANNPNICLSALLDIIDEMCIDKISKGKAYMVLGGKFDPTQGGKEEPKKAYMCYQKADELGIAGASMMIGHLFHGGELGNGHHDECVKWYTRSFELGNPYAMVYLGEHYKYWRNLEEAEECFLKALECNCKTALRNLGYLYKEIGRYQKAIEYLTEYVNSEIDQTGFVTDTKENARSCIEKLKEKIKNNKIIC